jgi:hypothetical protein
MADQREAPESGGGERPSSHSPISVRFFLERGGSRCPDRAGFWRADGKSGQRLPPRRKSQCGEWERTCDGTAPVRDPVGRFSAWVFLAGRRWPLAPLLSALIRAGWPAARWGPSFWWGAAISATISLDQDAERSQPHSDGCASLRCQSVASFLHATIHSNYTICSQ